MKYEKNSHTQNMSPWRTEEPHETLLNAFAYFRLFFFCCVCVFDKIEEKTKKKSTPWFESDGIIFESKNDEIKTLFGDF